jgi:hypothetical protein
MGKMLQEAYQKNQAIEKALKEKTKMLSTYKAQYGQLKHNVEMGPRLADAAQMEAEAALHPGAAYPQADRSSHERHLQGGYPGFMGHVRGHPNVSNGSAGPHHHGNQPWNSQNMQFRGYTARK